MFCLDVYAQVKGGTKLLLIEIGIKKETDRGRDRDKDLLP